MSDDLEFDERMSDADALMWTIEKDPLLRSTITTVMVFDRPIDRERLRRRLDRVSRVVPRLRQRVRGHTFSLAPPRWDVDPYFDLDYHVRFACVPSPTAHDAGATAGASAEGIGSADLRGVFDLAAPIAMQGFDRARPLWEFTFVDGLLGDRSALVAKVHHAITDGVGGVRLMMELLDTEERPEQETPLPAEPDAYVRGEGGRMVDALRYEGRRQLTSLGNAAASTPAVATSLRHDPLGVATEVVTTLGSVAKLISPATAPLSPLMRERSLSVHFESLQIPLDPMKRAARLVGGRLNDSFVAAVAGGLASYHRAFGAECDQLRMTMPINVRTEATQNVAGNRFAPARFPVPVGIADPIVRMNAVRAVMAAQRREPALALTDTLAGLINRLPATASTGLFGSMLKGIDFVTSNVPGPPIPVYLEGARLERQIAFGPMTGAATNVTLFSYLDQLDIGVNVDPHAVRDPALLVECLEKSFAEILALA
jgi:WS/DGAT/MGAT family acyltransferase